MLTKFVLAFAILALIVATAGTVPAKGPTYKVTLTEAVVLHGTALKAGDYKMTVNAGKVTFIAGKEAHDIPANVETGKTKYFDNEIEYQHTGTQATIKEIGVGGTKTKVTFN